jgi:hypothetical protein
VDVRSATIAGVLIWLGLFGYVAFELIDHLDWVD